MRRRAVITGIGVVTPLGIGIDAFWPRALAGDVAVAATPAHWLTYYKPRSTIWAPLPALDLAAYRIGRIEATQLDRCQVIALSCAWQALESARLDLTLRDAKKNTFAVTGVDPDGVAVFIGTGVGGISTNTATFVHHVGTPVVTRLTDFAASLREGGLDAEALRQVDAIRDGLRLPARFNPFSVSMVMPNAPSAVVGIKFGFHGPNRPGVGACASGTMALGAALRAVQAGAVPLALAGGVDYLGDDWGGVFRGFDMLQTLATCRDDPSTSNRPFDVDRTGFLFAEGGGAVLVVEELEHARRRGAPVIAEVAGYAETFDGHSMMMMEPSATHIERMVRSALDDAGVSPASIDYVNAHGTGTILNDQVECAMLDRVFGAAPLINSTKSLVGHTLGASGAIEAVVTALSLRDQATHASANLETPLADLRFVRSGGPAPMSWALSESFAFGGHNAAVVLKALDA